MRSDAPLFTDSDYDYIMQRCDERPKHKVLKDLTEKYSTSTKRIYQIWRGEEVNRIAWDRPLDTVLKQTSVIDLQTEEGVPEGSDVTIQFLPETLSETLKAGACSLSRPTAGALLSKKTGQKKKAVIGNSETVRSQLLSERSEGQRNSPVRDATSTTSASSRTNSPPFKGILDEAEKNMEDDLEFDLSKMVSRCKKIVGNHAQKTR